MKPWRLGWIAGSIIAGSLALAGGPGHAAGGHATDGAASMAGGPVACVRTIPLQKGKIAEHILVYGSVIAAPGALRTVSLPFESQVVGVMVNAGQEVAKGDHLLRVQPSPDTRLRLQEAQNAHTLAQQRYRQLKRQRQQKLATNAQLLQARQALDQARLRLESMQKRGIDGERTIAAEVDGLVKTIAAQEGAIVAAGNPIMQIVAQNRIEVLLGVETEDISRVHDGQAVVLTRVNAPAEPRVDGTVRRISYAVDPATRLVDVFVTPVSTKGFLLGETVQGKIVIRSADGWIVPRSAVLLEGDRHILFTVRQGLAVQHTVAIGIENARQYQVIGKDLQAGEPVVVSGNYALADGMAVTTGRCR